VYQDIRDDVASHAAARPLVELGRSIRTVGDMVSYGPNVTKL
jgi:hypothetical protein